MIRPYASGKRWTLYRGDALGLLQELPDASVDGLVTDPPYSSGGQFRGDRSLRSVGEKYLSGGSATAAYLPQFAGDNRDALMHLLWCQLWLHETLRVVRPGAVGCVFTDWRQVTLTDAALQLAGWSVRGLLPWIKPHARPQPGKFSQNAEFVWWASAGGMESREVYIKGYFEAMAPTGGARLHVTQKPVDVMTWLLGIVPAGGTVLDPFAGSGSTGVAALTTGRAFIGCEATTENADIAARRLEQAEADGVQATLFGGAA